MVSVTYLFVDSADTYTVPVRFVEHIAYTLAFGTDTAFCDSILADKHFLYGFRTLVGNACVHFRATFG